MVRAAAAGLEPPEDLPGGELDRDDVAEMASRYVDAASVRRNFDAVGVDGTSRRKQSWIDGRLRRILRRLAVRNGIERAKPLEALRVDQCDGPVDDVRDEKNVVLPGSRGLPCDGTLGRAREDAAGKQRRSRAADQDSGHPHGRHLRRGLVAVSNRTKSGSVIRKIRVKEAARRGGRPWLPAPG